MSTRRIAAAVLAAALVFGTGNAVYSAAGAGDDGQGAVTANVQPHVTGSNCELIKVDFATSSTRQKTTSTTYVDVVDSVIPVTIGGSSPTCLEADFTAQASAPSSVLRVRAVLDGTTVGEPADVKLVTLSDANTHGMNFFWADVPAGSHSVKMQYLSSSSVNEAIIYKFSFAARHN
jgi:hypothetical protein